MDKLWYNYDLSDTRDQVKCIKQLERVCRSSLEYDEWQRHCKYKDSTDCPVCGDNYYDNNSKCESHHHPKTLYTIVEEILDDHLEKNDIDEQTGIAIVQEIMDKHMLGQVSYINLCQHCHKKYHAGHPDVENKLNEIFMQRAADEMKNDVEEEDEPLVIQTFEEPVPEGVDIGFNTIKTVVVQEPSEIEVTGDLIVNYDQVPKEVIPPAPEIVKEESEEQKEPTKQENPEVVHIETNDSFVTIDIGV